MFWYVGRSPQVDYPNDPEVLEIFECDELIEFRYVEVPVSLKRNARLTNEITTIPELFSLAGLSTTMMTNLSYGFKHLYRVVRTLQTSVKSSVRIDRNGVLSIQFLLPEIKSKLAYIDFLVSSEPVYLAQFWLLQSGKDGD